MSTLPTYATGTVSVNNGDTAATFVGAGLTEAQAMAGDLIQIDNAQPVELKDYVDATHVSFWAAWNGGNKSAAPYQIIKKSPLRYNASQTMMDVSQIVATMNTDGYYYYVKSTETVPNPSYGNEGQFAMQATTGKLWLKQGGIWVFVGVNKGFGLPLPWSGATAYNAYDVVSIAGSTYVCILAHTNHAPPNATYWTLLASIGQAATVAVGTVTTLAGGATATVSNSGTSGAAVLDFGIPRGRDYVASSTSSLAIGTGSKALTVPANLAYSTGVRVRASSASAPSNWMEGIASYSGTTMTVTVDNTNGSGTFTDWNINIAGEPGAGDMSSANALSELSGVAATARANIGAVSFTEVPGRNRLINGQFVFNQRGVGGTDNTYSSDRWRTLIEGSGVNLFPDNYNAAGGNVPGIAMQFTGTTDKCGFFQIVEGRNCKDLRGKTVTLSLLMLVSNVRLGNMKIGILEWTGTEDATSADPIASWGADGVTPTPATNWTFKNTPANLSVTTASALYSTTVTLGTTFNNLAVMIWNDDKAYTANDNFSITNVQLEEGGVATHFDQRTYGEELRRCLRYCLALGSNGSIAYELFAPGSVSSATNFYASVPFGEKMRVPPALIASAASAFVCAAGGVVAVGSALSLSVSSMSAAQLALTTSGLTGGHAGSLQANNTAAAKLVFDAEL